MQHEDISIQECIPVGCVPSALAAVGSVCPGGGGVCPSAEISYKPTGIGIGQRKKAFMCPLPYHFQRHR